MRRGWGRLVVGSAAVLVAFTATVAGVSPVAGVVAAPFIGGGAGWILAWLRWGRSPA